MHVFSKSTLCLAFAAAAAGAHAQVNNNPATIAGTYAVTTTQNCLWADRTTATPEPFTLFVGANGQTHVQSNVPPTSPPSLHLISTASHLTMVISPTAGTMTSNDLHVTKLDEDRGGNPVLERTVRTMSAPFTVDQASGTLLVGTRTEQGQLWDGSTAVWTASAGAHLRTTDLGQTIFGWGSDTPELIDEVITGPSGPRSIQIVCDRSTTGRRISLKF